MKKRTAIYVRVSTPEQKVDMQLNSLQEFVKKTELEITHEYVEYGVSGKQQQRPQLNELMTAARNREFTNVLVWKFDRFARSTSHLLKALEEFNHLGIRFISVRDQIDTDSPIGKAMFVLIGAMAELEGDLISERVKEGMRVAKAKGIRIGRPSTPKRIVRKIQKMAKETDLSINQIRREVAQNVSRAVVGKIVQKARKNKA